MHSRKYLLGAASALTFFALNATAQLVVSDTLTGATNSYSWQALSGACLTAGSTATGVAGQIPGCQGLAYYSGKTQVGGVTGRLPDTVGSGALRLTNGDTTNNGSNGDNQNGAVVSTATFPTNQGLEVTFKTVTYGGDGNNGTGADGISFFLADGTKPASVGGLGGSLGYSCSNVNGQYNGVVGGYIGVGIDEYGNFANAGDNTNTGTGFQAGRISLRGAGSTAFATLSTDPETKDYYPTSLSAADREAAVKNTCKTGTVWNYSGSKKGSISNKANTGITLASLSNAASKQLPLNYAYLQGSNLPSGVTIANQQGVNRPLRGSATPITYGLKITQDGLLSLSYSVNGGSAQNVITNRAITASNGPLPASFRFGFSAGTGGSNNVHEIMCFKAAQINTSASSAGINIQQSAKVQVGTQLYLAYYHPTNWWGQMTAQNLVEDTTNQTVSINPVANWDASCVLTGGACSATGGTKTVQAPTARNMLSWNGTTGVPLTWTGGLTNAQKTALDPSASGSSSSRLDYLRGVRTNELTTTGGGTFRVRDSVLGDIVNSSPTWVGAPNLPYTGVWKDALRPTATMPEGSTSYATFASNNATRTNVVYVGANDGLLHGFRAGAYTAAGAFDTTAANDGRELLAYMPAAALSTIYSATNPALDFSSPQYSHNAFVDATPGSGDLYYGGNWHTWLVGGLGAGGNATGVIGDAAKVATGALYALDITTPGNFSESNASSLVVGEWNSSNLSCAGDTTGSMCKDSLGSTYGTPIIRRLHDGNWAVIFGNGLNSLSGKAGIYVMTVDQTSGAKTFRFLPAGTNSGPKTTGTGSSTVITARNGIAYVTSADLDGDHVTDYVYGGDVFGNVWRFDLTSATPSDWGVRAAPVFSTGGLPITTRLTVTSAIASSTAPRVIVSFGTGQIYPQTLTSAAMPATGTQAIFGIWDWDMGSWNTKGSVQYIAQTVNTSTATLRTQTATTQAYASGNISGVRTVTQNKVCWVGSTACGSAASSNTDYGWKLALPASNEQIIYNPVISDGLFLVNTTLPQVSQTLSCDSQPASGFTMAISPDTGGAPTASYFGDATNTVVTVGGLVVSGIGLSGVGSPSIVSTATKKYLATQTVSGVGSVTQVNPGANGKGGRVTWVKLR
ncbi:MAG: pilus assembly protein PilY [Alcaligenaceae bacterium]|nr:MAG: pilus assembly protein PilY [Alcaligenaceae bacterium]